MERRGGQIEGEGQKRTWNRCRALVVGVFDQAAGGLSVVAGPPYNITKYQRSF
jgi:hypothetical protein